MNRKSNKDNISDRHNPELLTRGDRNENMFNYKNNFQSGNRDIKQELIKYIYSTIDISQFKYDLLKYQHQMNKFISEKYYVAPNYSGKDCFLVFTKLKSKYYSFLVDKKQLCYTFDKIKIDNIYIHHCNANVDISIYGGTIFDGIYIRKGNVHEFIITDVYHYKGTDYSAVNLKHKLFEIKIYLENIGNQMRCGMDRISTKTYLELKVNKINEIINIREFIKKELNKISESYHIRGLSFYPEISGNKMIYMFNSCNNPNSGGISPLAKGNHLAKGDHLAKGNHLAKGDHPKVDNKLIRKTYVAKTDDPVYAILEMKETSMVDNYKLFAVEQINIDGNVRLKKCQMDIAYIPCIRKSVWCRDIINNSKKGSVFVKCIWREEKKKWEPLELEKNVRLPTLIDDIRKDLFEIELSDSGSDDD